MGHGAKFVRERITAAFLHSGLAENAAQQIAFHMTDWEEDLEQIQRMYSQVHEISDDELRELIISFLTHVPNHVAAAKKLIGLGPIEDIFEVGVLEEDED